MGSPEGAELLAWTQALGEEVHAQMHGQLLPAHVLHRVALLLGRQELRYVDVSASDMDPEHFSGRILIWTSTHLAIVDLTNVLLAELDYYQRDDPSSRVEVRVVPRRSLSQLSIPASPGDNRSWQDSASVWPRRAKLALGYEGLEERISVPSTQPRQGFVDLVQGLLNDQL